MITRGQGRDTMEAIDEAGGQWGALLMAGYGEHVRTLEALGYCEVRPDPHGYTSVHLTDAGVRLRDADDEPLPRARRRRS